MLNELEKIIDMGFNGVILDNVDSCMMWEEPEEYGLGGLIPRVTNASEWIINLVHRLSSYAKSREKNFIVIVNIGGALELLENETFIDSIDVVLREEVWYSNNEQVNSSETNYTLYWLKYAKKHGREVIVLDYAWTRKYIEDTLSKARQEGFLHLFHQAMS